MAAKRGGRGTEATTAPVLPSSMVMDASSRFTTQIDPSPAWASVVGWRPTRASCIFWRLTALMTVTVSLSGLTFHTCVPDRSRMMEEAEGAAPGRTGVCTDTSAAQLVLASSTETTLRTV